MTKKLWSMLFALGLSPLTALAQGQGPGGMEPSLIPLPAGYEAGAGSYTFGNTITTYADKYAGDSIRQVLDRFIQRMTVATGTKAKKVKKENKAAIALKLSDAPMPMEAYELHVTREGVEIEASRPAGFFYGLQTLAQLLPSRATAAGSTTPSYAKQQLTVPCCEIEDAPRFSWRGFMLDEGRHFFGKEEVKKIIDAMAAYKMNRFHWHLTEDQGWRIEIKKYPKLTQVGAWRNSKVLGWGDTKPDGKRYGGFYTADDVKEVVAYARERFVEIVPEVDIPGHSQAAVAAYPEFLSCDPEKKHEVWLWQGVSNDVINVSNPKAVQFAKDVVDELSALFPFGYIHLGGDECPTTKWERNADCQRELAKIGSKNFRDLQVNFYRQIADYMASKPQAEQKKLIFWNEALHAPRVDTLGKNITIMAWIGADNAAKDAAKRGMTTILSPQIPYYINRRQSSLKTEPRSQGNGSETVEAVYNYEPMKNVPAELQKQYLGVQANFWTEWVEEADVVEYLIFPRLAAVAEAGWTPQSLRKYPEFVKRLQKESEYYKFKGMKYGKHVIK